MNREIPKTNELEPEEQEEQKEREALEMVEGTVSNAAIEENADRTITSENENADTDEEDIPVDPLDERVFGMPRMCFHGAAFGVAGGYIVSGLIGLVWGKTPSATTCAIACAAVGYLLTKRQHKKLIARRDAEKQE